MSQASDNPYSFAAKKELPRGPEPELQFFEAYQFVFQNPNWMTNILLVIVSMMIPVIGGIVTIGYFLCVVESLHFRLSPTYPDYDFNRFTDYLLRGLWAFLVALVGSFCLVPVLLAIVAVPMVLGALIASAAGPAAGGVAFVVVMIVAWLLWMAVAFVAQMMFSIMMLRAAWTEDFMEGLNFSAAWDFVSKMWLELLLKYLFLAVTAPVVALCGLALCIVGYFPAIVLIMFAQHHFQAQIYGIYLARGGIPIVVKKKPPPVQSYAGASHGPYPPGPLK